MHTQRPTPSPLQIQMACLDAIAVGESGGDYSILFGGTPGHSKDGHHFLDFSRFPVWPGVRTQWGMTHAAGRYQFEPATWHGAAAALELKDFTPASQDAAAWWLARVVYSHMTGRVLADDLQRDILGHVVPALHSTWTSLSPASFPGRFHAALIARTRT